MFIPVIHRVVKIARSGGVAFFHSGLPSPSSTDFTDLMPGARPFRKHTGLTIAWPATASSHFGIWNKSTKPVDPFLEH
jgi:hypothetical protein